MYVCMCVCVCVFIQFCLWLINCKVAFLRCSTLDFISVFSMYSMSVSAASFIVVIPGTGLTAD